MIKVNDKWLRISLPLLPSVIYLYDFWLSGAKNAGKYAVYILTTILLCEGMRWLVYGSKRWIRGRFEKAKRNLLVIPTGIMYCASVMLIGKVCRNILSDQPAGAYQGSGFFTLQVQDKKVELDVVAAFSVYGTLIFILLWIIYELAFHFSRHAHTAQERDRLEKEKLQAELQQLKGIINPHFLFNNLNSLSSLISEDPVQAEGFLDEFTKVFRYLLRNNETELTTLAEEIKFIQSYQHLLQTRYGAAISLRLDIDPSFNACLLPPLTLQLLVENAVKHNRIHKEYPLEIEIVTEENGKLIVRNNLAAREQRSESTGIGLRSINSRYRLLNYTAPVIEKTDTQFRVTISLIHPSHVSAATVSSLPVLQTDPRL
jgi:hypothetical protein